MVKKIAILTSGGDCAGLNAVIRAVTLRAHNKYNWEVYGIKDGTLGLLKEPLDFIKLTPQNFEGSLMRMGGTFLGSNNKISKKSLYNSVNTMWYLAGDNSTDFNFYTKRLILSGVYTNALFVFFSKEMKHVEENIDKNLKRISKIPRIKERISFIKDNAPKFLKSFLT